jgi:hypothetical protein
MTGRTQRQGSGSLGLTVASVDDRGLVASPPYHSASLNRDQSVTRSQTGQSGTEVWEVKGNGSRSS